MNLLKTITQEDIFPNKESEKPKKYSKRQTVKSIVYNDLGEVALVTNPIHGIYLLPGGGAESENLAQEIKRECLEEISWNVDILSEIGKTRELRDCDARDYTTTCYLAKTKFKVNEDLRTDEEKNNGLVVRWFTIKQLIEVFQNQEKRVLDGNVEFYNTAFNIIRDKIFIDKWLMNKKIGSGKSGNQCIY